MKITTEFIDSVILETKKYIEQSLLDMTRILNQSNMNLLEVYQQRNFIPFSFDLVVENNKKVMKNCPNFSNITTYDNKYINHNNNALAIRTGEFIDNDHALILIDVDLYKDDTRTKWESFLFDNNIANLLNFNTPIQKTGNNGIHYLFKVYKDNIQYISKNLTGLNINGNNLNIDIKFKNGLMYITPTSYKDNNDDIKFYSWLKHPSVIDVMELPGFIFDIIVDNINNSKIQFKTNISNIENIEEIDNDNESDDEMIEIDINQINELKKNSNDKTLADVKLLLECIKLKYISNYKYWHDLGIYLFCISSSDIYLELWNELSKKSKKYSEDIERCNKEWAYFNKRNYSGNGLIYLYNFVKRTNLKKLNLIEYHLNFKTRSKYENILENGNYYNVIKFNSKFITQSDIFMNAYDNWVKSNTKCLCIKSRYGSGKTRFIEQELLVKFNQTFKKVLFLTYRKSLTRDIYRSFQNLGFESYMDIVHLDTSNRLICQYESVKRLFIDDPFTDEFTRLKTIQYDLIIIDEAKSFFIHTFSPTQKKKEQYNFVNVFELCSHATKLIYLDGDNDSQVYYNSMCHGDSIFLENEYNNINKTMYIYNNRDKVFNLMCDKLNNNKKIVIVCQSANHVLKFEDQLKNVYPQKVIKYYIGDETIKSKIEELNNVNDSWINCDILIYSPTVEAGIDFNVQNVFDSLFVVLCDRTNSARALHQQQNRVRYFNENEIHVLNDNQYFYDEEYRNYWTFKQVEESLNYFLEDEKTIIDNQVIKINNVAYRTNYIYYKLEQLNSHKHIFLNLYYDMAINKGYTVKFINDDAKLKKEKGNISFEKFLDLDMNKYSTNKEIQKYEQAKQNIEDKETKEEFDKQLNILKQVNLEIKQAEIKKLKEKDQIENVEDNIFLNKMFYMELLGKDSITNDDEDLIKPFWKNISLIQNYLNLFNLSINKSGDIVRQVKEIKTIKIDTIIKNLGFSGITDKTYINKEVFQNNINLMFDTGGIFENIKPYKALFGLSRKLKDILKDESLKAKMGIINGILNNYCLGVKMNQKTINNKAVYNYTIEHINNIKKVIKNKITNYKTIIDDIDILKFFDVESSEYIQPYSIHDARNKMDIYLETNNKEYLRVENNNNLIFNSIENPTMNINDNRNIQLIKVDKFLDRDIHVDEDDLNDLNDSNYEEIIKYNLLQNAGYITKLHIEKAKKKKEPIEQDIYDKLTTEILKDKDQNKRIFEYVKNNIRSILTDERLKDELYQKAINNLSDLLDKNNNVKYHWYEILIHKC